MTSTYHAALDTGLGKRLERIHYLIDEAARKSGRTGKDVRLVGISKTVTRASVNAAYAAGLREFGENRIDMAVEKFAENVPDDLILHMVGPLRGENLSNIAGQFALIHSLGETELADSLNKRSELAGTVQPVLLQLNVGREEQKHGCSVEDAPRLLEHVLELDYLDVQGFMTMAPYHAQPEETRPVFAEMREIAEKLRTPYPDASLDTLSMGMTNDFQVAVEEGSTMVRVGRAIFHAEHAI
ncbi:YggS family pyridoxal phosphate-dependent enzyme [soil metagenome]